MRRIAVMCVALALYLGSQTAVHAQITVIVNKANATTNFSTSDLKNIFTGDMTRFASGTNITLVTYKADTDTRKKFYTALGKRFSECQASLLKRIMNDGLKPPVALENDDDVAAFVAKTPGAIGFVSVASVGAAKAVTVDGKKQMD